MKKIYRADNILIAKEQYESFSTEHGLEKMLYLILREEDEKLAKRKMPNIAIYEGKHN